MTARSTSSFIARILALVLAVAAAACASKGPPASSGAPEAAVIIDTSAFVALVDRGDSTALAKRINAYCASSSDRQDCYQSLLSIPASTAKVRIAMGTLGRLASLDPEIRRSGHVYAHAIGIAAGTGRRDVAEAFGECSESFQSGCYHGVIQAWFAGLDSVSAAEANALCAPFRKSESDRWIRFQCVHGMGHGLTMLYEHDLTRGLSGCDLLSEWWDRHSCYSGAFMENIVNVTMPHHPASGLARHGGKPNDSPAGTHDHAAMEKMEGHDMTAMDHARPKFKAVDPADQHYPCSIMPDRYLGACYEMQTSVMLYNNKGDIGAAAKECDRAPLAMRTICHASLGRDISSYSQQDHREAIRMCLLDGGVYQPWCYYGVVKNFIDLEARPEDGIGFCRDVTGDTNKAVCYNAVGEQIMALTPVAETRRSLCATAEERFLDACLYGARVSGVKAPDVLLEVWASVRR